MIGNNLIFFAIWWIFFRAFKTVGQWRFDDMVALLAVAAGSYGLSKIFFGGTKEISRMIITGNLDPFMTQPKNLLLHLVGAKSYSKGWGQLMTSMILVILGGQTTLGSIPLLICFMINGALIFGSAAVIAHSMAFWFGSIETIAKKYCDSLFLFVHYPVNIYSGFLQIIMFTLFPSGIIGYLPVEVLRSFSWKYMGILVFSSALFVSLAFSLFHRGLKRYESGNHFGVRF